MKSILDQDLILKGKKVIVRVDFNVPMKNGTITEASRIIKILPTIKLLIKKKSKDNNIFTYRASKRKGR